MKKLFAILLACAVIFLLVGCGEAETVPVNMENQEELTNTVLGKSAMVEIGDGLWYDSATLIAYWWNGTLIYGYKASTTPSPYYAPNGLPYRYNPETNTFEEIVRGE